MKKILFVVAILLIIIGAVRFTQGHLSGGTAPFFKKTPVITIGAHNFNLATAFSQKEQQIGLSNTKSMSQNQGMIFIFAKPAYYPFWMKNMKFSIDIIYIKNDVIVTIVNSAQAPNGNNDNLIVYSPTMPSDKVLEIQAGLSKKYNFKIGDKVKIEGI